MKKVTVKIPRRKQRLKIVRSQELLNKQIELERKAQEQELIKQTVMKEPEPDEIEIPVKRPKTLYTEYFTISDSNQPIQISLSNIPPESISVHEAKIEIQRSYDKGFVDGKETSDAEYRAEIIKYEDWIKRIDSVILEIKDKFLHEARKFEEIIIDTSLMIATEILGHEIDKDTELIIKQVKNAIASLDDDEIFSIHLHPDDVEMLESVKSNLTDDRKRMDNVKIVPDRSIDKGGCIIRSIAGSIDARIKTQLDNAKRLLQKSLEDQTIDENDMRESAVDLDDKSMKIQDQIDVSDFDAESEGGNADANS